MIKLISFDLDGTLLDKTGYDDVFWYGEVPRLYAQQHKIPLDEAKSFVQAEYDWVGKYNPNWYRPSFWFRRFGLKATPKRILEDMRHRIKLFPEVKRVLEQLSQRYPLIVITHSSKEFVDIKMKTEAIEKYFKYTFSVVDEFNMVRKTPKMYRFMLKIYKVKPSEVAHVGDDWEFDYLVPKKLGINAFYLDRKKEKKEVGAVYDLKEFVGRVGELDKPSK